MKAAEHSGHGAIAAAKDAGGALACRFGTSSPCIMYFTALSLLWHCDTAGAPHYLLRSAPRLLHAPPLRLSHGGSISPLNRRCWFSSSAHSATHLSSSRWRLLCPPLPASASLSSSHASALRQAAACADFTACCAAFARRNAIPRRRLCYAHRTRFYTIGARISWLTALSLPLPRAAANIPSPIAGTYACAAAHCVALLNAPTRQTRAIPAG